MSLPVDITQAGVAIAFSSKIKEEFAGHDEDKLNFGTDFSTALIATIILAQLIGPPLFAKALKLVGEVGRIPGEGESGDRGGRGNFPLTVWWWKQAEEEMEGQNGAGAENGSSLSHSKYSADSGTADDHVDASSNNSGLPNSKGRQQAPAAPSGPPSGPPTWGSADI